MSGGWRSAFRRRENHPPASAGDTRTAPPRVLFYSHDFAGLGHIRRTLNIAGELANRRPDASLLALTTALTANVYDLPRSFDFVRLPNPAKEALYAGRAAIPSGWPPPGNVWTLREGLIRETAAEYAPHLFLVDDAPGGVARELVRTLDRLRAVRPPVALILGLKDILDDPRAIRRGWRAAEDFRRLEKIYDRILIYGSPDVFDAAAEYGFPPAVAAKTTYCGYLRRPHRLTPPAEIRRQLGASATPLVVATAGGGGTGANLLGAFLAALRHPALTGVAGFVVAGPLLPERERTTLAATAAEVPGVTLVRSTDDLPSYLNAADVVVSQGGFNTMSEAAALGKRIVVVPLVAPWREQLVRAERWATLGLCALLHPDALTPDRLAAAVRAELDTGVSPPQVLDFGGLDRVGAILSDTLATS